MSRGESSCLGPKNYVLFPDHTLPLNKHEFQRYFYRTKVPCLVVSTKGDQFQVEQNFEHQPVDFCLMHQLPRPIPFRDADIGNASAPVFTQLATMAVFP